MKPTTNQIINRVFAAVCGFQIVKGGGGGYNSLKGACIRGFSALSAAIFSATIRKIIIAAAVVFAAGFTTSANAAGAIGSGFSSDGTTNFIIGVAVGYAETGPDPITGFDRGGSAAANAVCTNHPDTGTGCGDFRPFTNLYAAVYADLSDIQNIADLRPNRQH